MKPLDPQRLGFGSRRVCSGSSDRRASVADVAPMGATSSKAPRSRSPRASTGSRPVPLRSFLSRKVPFRSVQFRPAPSRPFLFRTVSSHPSPSPFEPCFAVPHTINFTSVLLLDSIPCHPVPCQFFSSSVSVLLWLVASFHILTRLILIHLVWPCPVLSYFVPSLPVQSHSPPSSTVLFSSFPS